MCDRIDTSALVDIYADGWCVIDNLGTNFRQVFFAWMRQTNGLYAQMPVASLVRPQSSIMPTGRVAAVLRSQPQPTAKAAWERLGVSCN